MSEVSVSLRNIEGTEAALGWAGSHTIVADRPAGKAGGLGLGFNGAELLAFAIGGCFCNDLRYTAHKMGVAMDAIKVDVALQLEGEPPLATAATITVACKTLDGSWNGYTIPDILKRAKLTNQRGLSNEPTEDEAVQCGV